MKEHPIIFRADSVRAILDGRKTQTRRVVKGSPASHVREVKVGDGLNDGDFGAWFSCRGPQSLPASEHNYSSFIRCPYGKPGSRLWVREPHLLNECVCQAAPAALRGSCRYCNGRGETVAYKADATCADDSQCCRYRASMFMPRWACRLTLEVTAVRVERLQDISESDVWSEGVVDPGEFEEGHSAVGFFREVWEKLNGKKHPWDGNPWVWVVEFKRTDAAIDTTKYGEGE